VVDEEEGDDDVGERGRFVPEAKPWFPR